MDGCRGVHWHAASAKQGKKSDWWVNMTYLGKHVCVGNDRKDNVVTTCPKKWEKETNRQNRKHSGKPNVQTLQGTKKPNKKNKELHETGIFGQALMCGK